MSSGLRSSAPMKRAGRNQMAREWYDLSQSALVQQIGVASKATSNWETRVIHLLPAFIGQMQDDGCSDDLAVLMCRFVHDER